MYHTKKMEEKKIEGRAMTIKLQLSANSNKVYICTYTLQSSRQQKMIDAATFISLQY